MSAPSPTVDILAENLLSDEEHKSLDLVPFDMDTFMDLGLSETQRLSLLVYWILKVAPPKANFLELSPVEIERILTDERVYEIVQEAAQLQTFRNVRNLGKSLFRGKRFNCIKSPFQLRFVGFLSSPLK